MGYFILSSYRFIYGSAYFFVVLESTTVDSSATVTFSLLTELTVP